MKTNGSVAVGNRKVRSGLSVRRHAAHTSIGATAELLATIRPWALFWVPPEPDQEPQVSRCGSRTGGGP